MKPKDVCQAGVVIVRAEVMKQHSSWRNPCEEGRTWGITVDRKAIWVDSGCRADFRVFYRR